MKDEGITAVSHNSGVPLWYFYLAMQSKYVNCKVSDLNRVIK